MDKLADLIAGYPADAPQTLFGLVEANPETLDELPRKLRQHGMDLRRRDGLPRIASFADVTDALAAGRVVHPWTGMWRCYALDADRHPVLAPTARHGRNAWTVVTTKLVPTPADLHALPGAKFGKRPGWLAVYGGSPSVFDNPKVVARMIALVKARHIVDVVCAADGEVTSMRNAVLFSAQGQFTHVAPGAWEPVKEILCSKSN